MEIQTNYSCFEKYMCRKIETPEKLIQLTRESLPTERPKIWKIKQLRSYYKGIKQANEQVNKLNWMIKELDVFYLS